MISNSERQALSDQLMVTPESINELNIEECREEAFPRAEAALRMYGEALLTGTTEDVLAADAEVDAATKEEMS